MKVRSKQAKVIKIQMFWEIKRISKYHRWN